MSKRSRDLAKAGAIRAALAEVETGREVEIGDTVQPGFGARARRLEDGSIVGRWQVRLTAGGKTKRRGLGPIAEMSGAEARAAAIVARAGIAKGEMVQTPSKAARAAREAADAASVQAEIDSTTLADLLFRDGPDRKSYSAMKWDTLKSGREAVRSINSVFADILDKPAKTITKHDLERAVQQRADIAPHSASRALAYLRPAVIFWMKRGWMERDVLDLAEDFRVPVTKRDRVLSPDEWKSIWQAREAMQDTAPIAALATQLLIMTGSRNREVCELEVQHIDLDAAQFTVPTENSKNKDQHIVVLNDLSLSIIAKAMAIREEHGLVGRYLFSNDGTTPVWLGAKVRNRIMDATGTTGWTHRDLRRSMATHLAEAGVHAEIVDLMLNHRASATRSGVTAVYNKSLKLQERRAAAAKRDQITRGWLGQDAGKVVKIA